MAFMEETAATGGWNLRYISGAEGTPMHTTYYRTYARQQTWANLICDPIVGALQAMAQIIDNGVSKTITAVAVIVIAAAIVSVSSMAVYAFFQANYAVSVITEMGKRMDRGFDDLNRRLDDRGNNGGHSGP